MEDDLVLVQPYDNDKMREAGDVMVEDSGIQQRDECRPSIKHLAQGMVWDVLEDLCGAPKPLRPLRQFVARGPGLVRTAGAGNGRFRVRGTRERYQHAQGRGAACPVALLGEEGHV
jgi:hypothetical protein